MRLLILFAIIFLSRDSFTQDQSFSADAKELMKMVLNEFDDGIFELRIQEWDTSYFNGPPGYLCNLFDKADCKAMLEQAREDSERNWSKDLIRSTDVKIAKSRDYRNNEEIWSSTRPLFSTDRMKAIVHVGFWCGTLCGKWCTHVYVRNGNQWKKEKVINCWTG